ncbi:MAG: hypothetical protein KDB00_02980 [Planctomycetales bacterium]|nr:hypothetical protein [Planctomycetales bacterium]
MRSADDAWLALVDGPGAFPKQSTSEHRIPGVSDTDAISAADFDAEVDATDSSHGRSFRRMYGKAKRNWHP